MDKKINILGNFTKEEFLKDYWEKKPVLIKNAVEHIEELADIGDFIDMAADEEFETRLVTEVKSKPAIIHGPIATVDFRDGNKKTLICHNINLYHEGFHALEKAMNFLPHWIFDDVMATISNEGSTLGAHIDNYNVFLLQGKGKRKWELQLEPDKTYQENIELKILQNFIPDITWVLEPGDMIYVPPHVAHRGTSLTDSISYSIGFKSLDYEKLIKDFSLMRLNDYESDEFYRAPNWEATEQPFLADSTHLNSIYSQVHSELLTKQKFDHWLVTYLSTPRRAFQAGITINHSDLISALKNGQELFKDPYLRCYFMQDHEDMMLAAGGKEFKMDVNDIETLKPLFEAPSYDALSIPIENVKDEVSFFILCMIESGGMYLTE